MNGHEPILRLYPGRLTVQWEPDTIKMKTSGIVTTIAHAHRDKGPTDFDHL